MSSKWFDIYRELSPDIFSKPEKFEMFKRNLGLSSKKTESENFDSWSSVNRVSDILDLETNRTGLFNDRSKFWDSVIKDRITGKSASGSRSRFLNEHLPMSDTECCDTWSGISESARRIKNRFSRESVNLESEIDNYRSRRSRGQTKEARNLQSCSSDSSYGFADVTSKKGSEDRTWSRKSSCQGNVSFPSSSNVSVNSDMASEKSFGRSISINSEESVCTEKSADCSTVSEILPDGTNKTQFENNETWLSKSTSGSTVCEKRVRDSVVTEKSEDKVSDKTTKRTSYVERSATGSSLQEESVSERTMSCDKNGRNTVEHKTSSETYKKAYRSPRKSSNFYDELDSCAFQHRLPSFQKAGNDEETELKPDFTYSTRGKSVSEKISKLIDEAVHQDNLFKIPSNLETDIDRMTSDFADVKSRFGKEKRRHGRRRLSGTYFETGKRDEDLTLSRFSELKIENGSLLQENSKLQSIIQDVTAVNKRWQKYNNERRLYVQKLLSTIQDLQEQINLISEKSAFRSTHQDDTNSLYQDIEKLKREYQEHITVLELQIKSHKDDWDAERKEKQKALHDKETMEQKIQELLTEIKFLKGILLEEKKRKLTCCVACRTNLDKAMVFPGAEFFPNDCFTPKTFRTAVHVPYKMSELSPEERFFTEYHAANEESRDHQQTCFSETNTMNESYVNERFSEFSNFSHGKKTSGDTIVVEDENGLRLSITEQFPSKDSLQLKSILKRTDRKMKLLSKAFPEQSELKISKCGKLSARNRKSSAEERNLPCEECESRHPSGCGVTIDFEKNGFANITSFTPYQDINASIDYDYTPSDAVAEFLKIGSDNRSKSEPNTRSNSSENLKPLRESSSWNNQCTNPAENDLCSGCDRSFPPSMHHPQFLNHPSQSERNHF